MPGRILVADDNAQIREVLQMSLESLGYEVLVAEDGDQALQRIHRDSPDLLILDVMMPKQNGFQICRKVKADPERSGTPVILLSAKSLREDVYWGKDCGANEYVTKPFSAKDLEDTIAKLLHGRAAGDSGIIALGFEDDLRRRQAAREEGALALVQWDARAMDVFRKKYGEVRYTDILDQLRHEGKEFVLAEAEGARVEFVETQGFRLLLSGRQEEAEELAEALCKRLTRLTRAAYDASDRKRKAIPVRDFKTGESQSVPLVSFTAELNPFGG